MISQLSLPRTELQVTDLNKNFLVQLPANLNLSEAIALQTTCQYLVLKKPIRIVLDLSQTTSIDSSGIGAITSILKATRKQDIELVIWSVHPRIKAALSAAGLDLQIIIDSETDTITSEVFCQSKRQSSTYHPSVHSQVKRLIDIIGALIGLGTTAILFVPVAIAIKLDSPGPILFSQIRCGWMGRRFRVWKFRSMVTNAEDLKAQVENQIRGPIFKNKADPRITRVGRFLRQTSIDEMPQFWNVLKGEMSLVGTRPPLLDEVSQYTLNMWQRLDVKPGITGEWQTHGRSRISNFEDVLRLDLRYQKNWSAMYDLRLIIKTLMIILGKDNGAS